MSRILDSLLFFKQDVEKFSDGYGAVTKEDRGWEDGYRNRWSYDKVVRSTHGVNCTGSCGWNVYVKNGIVTLMLPNSDLPLVEGRFLVKVGSRLAPDASKCLSSHRPARR